MVLYDNFVLQYYISQKKVNECFRENIGVFNESLKKKKNNKLNDIVQLKRTRKFMKNDKGLILLKVHCELIKNTDN